MMRYSVIPRQTVLLTALVSEVLLAGLALLWAGLASIEIELRYSWPMLVVGLAATLPLAIVNLLVFFSAAAKRRERVFRRFVVEVVLPLCGDLRALDALWIGLLAGVGEELFFRGVMNPALARALGLPLGAAAGSFLFAYVHFIGRGREYWPLVLFYTLFGLYFSVLVVACRNLLPAMIAHALYNFLAILYVRYRELPARAAKGD